MFFLFLEINSSFAILCLCYLFLCIRLHYHFLQYFNHPMPSTKLIKKKIKFSSYIGKFRVEQLQSHIWLTASSSPHIWGNIFAFPHILGSPSSYMTLQLPHSEFLYIWGKFYFIFYQCIVRLPCEQFSLHLKNSLQLPWITSSLFILALYILFLWYRLPFQSSSIIFDSSLSFLFLNYSLPLVTVGTD
jgi:hypothetical protein